MDRDSTLRPLGPEAFRKGMTMGHPAIRLFGALLGASLIGVLVTPGCHIQLCKGEGCGGVPDVGGWGGGGSAAVGGNVDGGAAGSEPMTSEGDALYALEHANPDELAAVQLRSAYASYALAGLVGSDVADPSTLDEATLEALIDQYTPVAWQQAQDWISSLDPAAIPLALVTPKYQCEQQTGCSPTDSCKFDNYDKWAYCVVTACGDGACPGCPDLFDLSKLVVKSWCSYTCMVDKQIVGIKIAMKIALFGRRARCLALEKPVACEGTCEP